MGLFSKDIKSMEDLFLHTLQDVYYAENQIVKSLPKMIEKSTNRALASGLRNHLAETEQQVSRLDQVFKALGQTPTGTDCPAMDGLIKEADNVAGEVDDKKVLDAAIIGSAQAIEHYEISRYGTLIAWAEELGHDNVIRLLKANLKEEKAADKKLNMLAEAKLNRKATGTRVAAARVTVKKRTGKATRVQGYRQEKVRIQAASRGVTATVSMRLAAHSGVSFQKAHQCTFDPGKAVADAPPQKRVS